MANNRIDVDSLEDFELESIFEKAIQFLNHSNHLKLKDEDKLLFYAYFKQATVGPCNTTRPGLFDFVGKAKWDAWNGLGKQDKEQSMRMYIKKLNLADPDWSLKQIDTTQPTTKKSESGGPVFSRMTNEDEEEIVAEDKKDLIYYVTKGNASKVAECIQKNNSGINNTDEQGLAALHYACDGGHLNLVELLLNNGANINLKDEEGQTPLHYACLVGHKDIVSLLLSRGAHTSIQDNEGQTAKDIASDEIQELFS